MKIGCVLTTHLTVKAELRRHPELQGRPVIIVRHLGSRQVVLDGSPQARSVGQGMPLQAALSLCKEATLIEADEPYYRQVFDEILGSLEQRSPLVEEAHLGCAYVGLDGLEMMYGGQARLATALLQAVPAAFNPRVGVAEGKFPAYIAAIASGPGQATKAPDDVAGFLRGFPVDLLPLPWEEKVRLRQLGLHTLGQVADLSVGPMQAQFGQEGRQAWELARGIDTRPLVPGKCEELVSEALTFPAPTISGPAILAAIESLLGRAFARPEVGGRYVRSVALESQVLRHPPWVRQFAFKDAVAGQERALFVIKCALESATFPGPLEDLKLTLVGLTGESGIQASLFAEVRQREQLREAVRQLEARLGGKPPIYQVRDIEPWSRIPERRQALIPFDP